jgi:hypothetical protein
MSNGRSGKERRCERRALIEAGRRALADGLPNPVPQSMLIGVGLILRGKLTARDEPAGASRADEIALGFASRAIDGIAARDKPDCRLGCAFCCHFAVTASPPEIFHLARSLRRSGDTTETVRQRAEAVRGLSLADITTRCMPCVLLRDGVCNAYNARPITCRQFMSRSALACEQNLKGEPVEIPVLKAAVSAGVLCRSLLLAASRAAGLSDECYELSGALAVALSERDAERRWLAGENVFAGVPVAARAAAPQGMIDQYAGLIRAWT